MTFAQLMPLFADFRKAVDDHIASLESVFELKRPFLLVLDTFEVVQYSDVDVRRIEDFVRVLTKSSNGLGWPRLRLIVSGRKKPEKFLGSVTKDDEVVSLGVLDMPGCVQMLLALAMDAGQPINPNDAQELIDAMIAALHSGKAGGLHPLSLKLLGTVLAGAKDSAGHSVVSQLISELKDQPTGNATLRKALIDGILVRRILEHVSDTRVRALADPGLVVRRITPAVIREVMARGTPKPGSAEDVIAGDSLDFEPWQLSTERRGESLQDEAEEIFDAFRREVSLVEMDEFGLRHRQDLRQEMLPLIRARRSNRFKQLHRLAFEYFRGQALLNPSDFSSCAEAVYHGLWLGAAVEKIDGFWPKSPGFDPRLDPEEFDDMPLARRYIRAKTRQALSSDEVAGLPRSIAIEWLISRQDTFLDDDYPNAVARVTLRATGEGYSGLDDHVPTAAIVARLLYRTGQWADSQHLIARHLVNTGYIDDVLKSGMFLPDQKSSVSAHPAFGDLLSLLRTWTTMSAKLGADALPLEAARIIGELDIISREPFVQTELLSFAAMGHRMLKQRSGWTEERRIDVARRAVQAAREVPRTLWRQSVRALRFAVLASEEGAVDLLQAYLEVGGAPPREQEAQPFIGRLLANAYRETGDTNIASELDGRLDNASSSAKDADYFQFLWSDGISRIAKTLETQPSQQLLLKKVASVIGPLAVVVHDVGHVTIYRLYDRNRCRHLSLALAELIEGFPSR